MTTYDSKLFEAAHKRFLTDPKTVTDEDLAQFTVVLPRFAERARAMRAGFVAAETEEQQKVGKMPMRAKMFIDWIENYLGPVLATHRHKSQHTQSRLDALEQRVFELELQRAADHVNANH